MLGNDGTSWDRCFAFLSSPSCWLSGCVSMDPRSTRSAPKAHQKFRSTSQNIPKSQAKHSQSMDMSQPLGLKLQDHRTGAVLGLLLDSGFARNLGVPGGSPEDVVARLAPSMSPISILQIGLLLIALIVAKAWPVRWCRQCRRYVLEAVRMVRFFCPWSKADAWWSFREVVRYDACPITSVFVFHVPMAKDFVVSPKPRFTRQITNSCGHLVH